MPSICVFCASSEQAPDEYLDLAGRVGAELAIRGHALVTGGSRMSCMGAVSRAARAGGAHTTGVVPRQLLAFEITDPDLDCRLLVDDMRARQAEMDRRADGFLALPGGLGTLAEILDIWGGLVVGAHSKPLVILDPDGLYEPLRQQHGEFRRRGLLHHTVAGPIWTHSVAEALDRLEAALDSSAAGAGRRVAIP